MQEEVENRTVTLVISATKLTGRVLKAAVAKFLAHQKAKIAEKKRAGPVKPTGKQTVKQLVGQNQGVANIEISDKNIKDFDRVARKYGVDYAVKKDKTLSPPKYMVFFKARDADALTAAFEEYTRNTARKRQKPSLIQHLHDIQAAKDIIKPAVKHKDKGLELRHYIDVASIMLAYQQVCIYNENKRNGGLAAWNVPQIPA